MEDEVTVAFPLSLQLWNICEGKIFSSSLIISWFLNLQIQLNYCAAATLSSLFSLGGVLVYDLGGEGV